MAAKTYRLLDRDGQAYESSSPGTLGGNRRARIYGRLDCGSARAAIAKGGYVGDRVFFADVETAKAAGYRPCGNCMRDAYRAWKREQPPRA